MPVYILLAFSAGVLAVGLAPALPPFTPWAWPLACASLGVRWPRHPGVGPALGAAVLGLLWGWHQGAAVLSARLPAELAGEDIWIEGRVAGLPRQQAGVLRVSLIAAPADGWRGGRVRLSWYDPPAVAPRPGERWRLRVRLRRPRGFANPISFDYETWLFARRVTATGYVRVAPGNRRLAAASTLSLDAARAALAARVAAAVDAGPAGALIPALTVGVREAMTPAQWSVLRATGTSHLMAISGLHLGLVALLLHAGVIRLWRRAGLPLGVAAPRAAAVAALGGAACYAALAGFSLPTQRALVMVAAGLGGRVLGRPTDFARAWALALAAVLAWDPLAGLSPGFWLSFAAVAVLIHVTHGRHGAPRGAARWLGPQAALLAGLAPVLVAGFGAVSLVSLPANLVAVPVVGLGVVPLCLAGAVLLAAGAPGGGLALNLAAAVLGLLWRLLEWLAAAPFALWQRPIPALAVAAAMVGMAWLLAPRGVPGRLAALALAAPLLLSDAPRPPPGAAWVTLLDVGQGLAAVVRTRHHTLVYDAGPRFRSGTDTGALVVAPFLRARGVTRVDRLMVSHGDSDHAGGAPAVLAAVPVSAVLAGEAGAVPGTDTRLCRRGRRWRWDGVDFAVLYPFPGAAPTGNNASCVLRVSAGGHRLLLTGDIEADAERALLDAGADPGAEVLLAPHHGSATSSSAALVAAVAPRYVLVSAGHDNRWGFPRPAVTTRYRRAGATVLNTAELGAIRVRLPASGPLPAPRGWREAGRRYWHER